MRACGLSTLIRLTDHEDKQKEALERTIQEFTNDPSL